MSAPRTLPFRLRLPGWDKLDWEGARSVAARVEGRLHLVGGMLVIEWAVTEKTQRVALDGITSRVEVLPLEMIELPVAELVDLRLVGGWWAPRLDLRARRLDAFDGIPTARPGVITLRIRRQDRQLAAEMAAEIERLHAQAMVNGETDPLRLDPGAQS